MSEGKEKCASLCPCWGSCSGAFDVDERQCGHQVASLFGEGGGDVTAGGMTDHDGVRDAELVESLADPARLLWDRVAASGRFGGQAMPEQVDPDDAIRPRQHRND